jgi:hypothetical protein
MKSETNDVQQLFQDFVQAAEYELGVHVNAANARAYLGCH